MNILGLLGIIAIGLGIAMLVPASGLTGPGVLLIVVGIILVLIAGYFDGPWRGWRRNG